MKALGIIVILTLGYAGAFFIGWFSVPPSTIEVEKQVVVERLVTPTPLAIVAPEAVVLAHYKALEERNFALAMEQLSSALRVYAIDWINSMQVGSDVWQVEYQRQWSRGCSERTCLYLVQYVVYNTQATELMTDSVIVGFDGTRWVIDAITISGG